MTETVMYANITYIQMSSDHTVYDRNCVMYANITYIQMSSDH